MTFFVNYREEDDMESKNDSKPEGKEQNTTAGPSNTAFNQPLLESKMNDKSVPKVGNKSNEKRIQQVKHAKVVLGLQTSFCHIRNNFFRFTSKQ